MTITINGNGTVTGVSVGGLPDGIVDTDMIADNAVTAAKKGAGGILQVVTNTATASQSTTSTSYVDTGLTCNITTTGSNKVLCIVSQSYWLKRDSNYNYGGIKILRDSTKILQILESGTDTSPYELGASLGNTTQTRLFGRFNATVLDTPGSAATYTYKTQCAIYQNSDNGTFYTQADGTVVGKSHITLIEVAA